MDHHLDSPARSAELRAIIAAKPALKKFYSQIYARYADSLERCPATGLAVELGSGGGFAQQVLPGLITTDILPYDGVDRVVDATRMPFEDESVRFLGMLNVFHHIPDVAAFLRESQRCLRPGGRLLIIDQHPGWIAKPVLKHLHHEPFLPEAADWRFESTGPLSGANGALAWIVFVRDIARVRRDYPKLEVFGYRPFAPLTYWLAGGLKRWSLLPSGAYGLASALDELLLCVSREFGSFVEVEAVRR